MGRGVNVGSNIWVQILALPHTDCVALGPSLNFVFLCVENGDSTIAAAADLGRVFVRTVKGAYPQWVPRLLGMSSLKPPPSTASKPQLPLKGVKRGQQTHIPTCFCCSLEDRRARNEPEGPGRAGPEVFRAGVPHPGTFTFDMIKNITRQTIHLVGGMVVAYRLPI